MLVHIEALVVVYHQYRSAPTKKERAALWVTLLACGVLWLSGVAFNHTASFYFWALVSLAMATANRVTNAPPQVQRAAG